MDTSTNPGNVKRRQEIIESALMLIHETGLGNLTMRKVAAQLGLTEAALYRYFPTKDELILAIHDHFNQTLGQATQEFLDRDDLTPAQQLEATWRLITERLQALDGFPVRLLAESFALESPQHRLKLGQLVTENQAHWEKILKRVLPADSPVRPREMALLVVGLPAAMGLWGIYLNDPDITRRAQEDLIPYMVRLLAGGDDKQMTAAV